jgi:hypothetical protein
MMFLTFMVAHLIQDADKEPSITIVAHEAALQDALEVSVLATRMKFSTPEERMKLCAKQNGKEPPAATCIDKPFSVVPGVIEHTFEIRRGGALDTVIGFYDDPPF